MLRLLFCPDFGGCAPEFVIELAANPNLSILISDRVSPNWLT